jgi:hypothetical protein
MAGLKKILMKETPLRFEIDFYFKQEGSLNLIPSYKGSFPNLD